MNAESKLLGHIDFYEKNLEKIKHYRALCYLGISVTKLNESKIEQVPNELVNVLTCIDFISYLHISFLDLSMCMKGSLKSETKWNDPFYLRVGSLIVYGTLENYKNYQKVLNDFLEQHVPTKHEEHREIGKEVRKFKKEHGVDSFIKNIRHNTIGHYSMISEEFIDRINGLKNGNNDSEKLVLAISKFSQLLNRRLLPFWNAVAEKYAENYSNIDLE